MKWIAIMCITICIVSGMIVGAVNLTADFHWDPSTPADLVDVHFYDDSTGNVVAWIWYFGDGASSTERNPMHRYADNGTYTVRLVVIDAFDNTDFVESLITVSNVPPVADAGINITTKLLNIPLNGNTSYDLDGTILNWTWDFDDSNVGYGKATNHTYATQGTYTVTLTVRDNDGAIDTDSVGVLVDTTAPVTNYSIGEEREWYDDEVTINLTTSDNLSKVNATFYKIDDKNWTLFLENITIIDEGFHTLYFYSTDNAGNVEQEKNVTTNIDYTPPTTACRINGTIGKNGWIKDEVDITLNATDALSGVNTTWYKIDDGDWGEYDNQIEFSLNGIHIIHFYSIDKAENMEKEDNITVKIDKNNPSTELTKPEEGYVYVLNRRIMPTLFDNTYIIGRFTIEADATDATSGINYVEFLLNGETLWKDYATPYEIEAPYRRQSSFMNTLSVAAYDMAGHTIETDELTYIRMF